MKTETLESLRRPRQFICCHCFINWIKEALLVKYSKYRAMIVQLAKQSPPYLLYLTYLLFAVLQMTFTPASGWAERRSAGAGHVYKPR